MKIAIATCSLDKIEGIKKGFSRFFELEEAEIQICSKSTDSGVPEQPFGEETYVGARNRVNNIKRVYNGCDFYVSCEAGIEEFVGSFFNVQVVCIFDAKKKKYLFGKSTGWAIPSEDIEVIKEKNLDCYLRNKGINSIDELLGTEYSRKNGVAQATELALRANLL